MATPFPREDNRVPTIGAQSTVSRTAIPATAIPLVGGSTPINGLTVAILDTNGNQVVPGGATLPVTVQVTGITAAGNGDNTIISAAGVGKSIYVFAWNISFSGTVNAKFTDGAGGTLLNGLMYGSQNAGGGNSVTPPGFLWKGSANTSLVLNLSVSVAVGGSVSYYII